MIENLRALRAGALGRQKLRLERAQAGLLALDRRFFWARLGVFLLGSVGSLFALVLAPTGIGLAITTAFVAVFLAVVILHRRVDRARRRNRLALALVDAQQARMRLDWAAIPSAQPVEFAPEHPFASDLNLVGSRSLHQLIDTAASQEGSLRLANWMLQPLLDGAVIAQRQRLVTELASLHGFRRRLALEGALLREETGRLWDGEAVLRRLQTGSGGSLLPLVRVLAALAMLNLLLYAGQAVGLLPALWPFSLALYAAIYLYHYRAYQDLFSDAYHLGKALEQFGAILADLEDYPYPAGSELARLCAIYRRTGQRPSQFLRKIVWITSAASLENNPILTLVINILLPWNYIFAHLLNGYKADLSRTLPAWLDTWYEVEGLSSLANFLFLNPHYTFPQVEAGNDGGQAALFEAKQLGHPLLRAEDKVRNDFAIHRLGEVALITGSNMSGKSTFLRTLGVNLCLAFAGGPVDAQHLRTGLWRVFTCIQVNDSLSYGISYFYAEVRRLKALLDGLAAGAYAPQFFLIDEIFRGTNNQERRIGSQAYVRALTQGYGAGAISTHDLELVKMADLGLPVMNYHFREELRDGRMVFDFRLRSGPCPTSNALKIMALEGLPVQP